MARLGDVCEIVSGTTPKTNVPEFWDGDIDWITPAELNDDSYVIYGSQRKITDKAVQSSGLKPFPAGTVLLSSRAPIGKVAIAGVEMYCNQGFKNLICSEHIYNKYLFWFLKSKTDYLNSLGRGATFKEISKSIVEGIDIPLPALETQQFIATLLDKISNLIALWKQQLGKLDELVKARFVEMFGNRGKNPFNYPTTTMGNIYKFQYGKGNNIPEDKGEYPCYGSNGIVGHHVEYNSEDSPIIGHIGAYAGIVNWGKGKHYVTYNGVICKLINEHINPIYGYYLLQIQDYNTVAKSGAAQPFVSYKDLDAPIVNIPPVEIQKRFASFVEQTNKSRLTIQQGLDKLERMKKALMQQYFG